MIYTFTPRYIKFIIPLCLLLASVLHAQNTATLTGTVTDSSSQIWAGATWIATLNVPGGGTPMWLSGGTVPRSYSGQLDSTGTFTSGSVIGRNSQIVPAGTTWQWTVYSLTSGPASVLSTPSTVTNTTFAAGGVLSAGVTPPSVPASNQAYAYNVNEIINSVNGNGYVNTISNTTWLFNGSAYVELGGGAGCTGPTGNYSLNNQVATLDSGCVAAIGSPFAVSISCTFSGTRETGNATTSPQTCNFGYSNGTPASGTLHDSVVNTITLTTPFTSGVLAHAYTTNQTFTVNATSTGSQNASNSVGLSFLTREFAGIGTAGATGATASGTSAVLVGATGTIPSAGLGTQSVYGPFTPSNQKIYVLGLSNSCTFTSGGFAFPMNAPVTFSFVNQYGSTVTLYDYESVNLLSATFTLNGTC